MSSLIIHTDEQQAYVATDTLATLPDGEPHMFTTKAFFVPHLRMIMCGTGVGGFLGRWFIRVNDAMVIRGIDHLNYHAPRTLKELWHSFKEEYPAIPDSLTTTVYHFGFSEVDGPIHSYAYRSTNDFASDALQHGLRVKPECQLPENYVFPADIKKMMDEQRAIQAARPKGERVYVGGEIQIHHLTQAGCAVFTLARFEDYDLIEQAIFRNFKSQN
jgi:hypothetical protein